MDPFAIHPSAPPPQFLRYPAITVASLVFDKDLLNRRAHLHLVVVCGSFLQRAIKASLADLGQLTHPLDTEVALQRHHFPDVVVDILPPEVLLCRRRASTFCKAPLKKSVSSVLSASARLSRPICFSSSAVRDTIGTAFLIATLSGSSCSRHLYSDTRVSPNSLANSVMLPHSFMRSTASRRNDNGYLATRFLATPQLLSLLSVYSTSVSISGVSPTPEVTPSSETVRC